MTKTVSANLLSHIAGEVTTLATCWKLTLVDNTVYGFTDHDADITYGGVTYSASSGQTPSSIETSDKLNVDNLDVIGLLDSATITEADLLAGVYDYAAIEVFLINYANTGHGVLKLRTGTLGQISLKRGQFTAELRGLMQHLQQTVGDLYSYACRADLGDSQCGVTLDGSPSYTVTGTVSGVTDNGVFRDAGRTEDVDYFGYGLLTWLTGDNAGRQMEVKSYAANGTFTLFQKMPSAIQVGDTYSVYAGCNKTPTACIQKFNNFVNYRGEPYIPGVDKMLETPPLYGTNNDNYSVP